IAEEAGNEQRDITEPPQQQVALRPRGLVERIGKHQCERPQLRAVDALQEKILRTRESGQQVDEVMLRRFTRCHGACASDTTQRIAVVVLEVGNRHYAHGTPSTLSLWL